MKPPKCMVLYTDKGPKGPCGQSMSITCPHTYFYLFDSFEAAQEYFKDKTPGRGGNRMDVRYLYEEQFENGGPVRWIDLTND